MKALLHPWWRALAALGLVSLAAATPVLAQESHVQASLVSSQESVQPGQSVTVALRFVHDPHWHTYWVNPGTGVATTLAWTLPDGYSAGDIQWPAPHVLKDHTGTVSGNGYEGETLFPVTIKVPASATPGSTVKLAAAAEWLMCDEMCVPGSAQLTLTLPVSAEAPKPDARWAAKIQAAVAALPVADPAWVVSASHDAKNVTLRVQPAAGQPTQAPAPGDLHFFSDDNFIAYELPQEVKLDGGAYVLTLPISPDGTPGTKRLVGVLTAEKGWRPDGSLRGLRVDVEFGAAKAATAPAANPAAGKGGTATTGGLLGTLALALVGGLILNLMPCVFPVLGIKILGFVNQSGSEKAKVVGHGLVFALGVLVSFWVLAGMLALLRQGGAQLGWGFQLQSPGFVFTLTALMLVFALNMSGLFEFGLSATGVGSGLQTKSGFAGSFFTGVLATVVATPCSAPFLAPALGAALALPVGESFLIFTAIALGLSLPYLLLSIFPQAVRVLPRPGAWMETFKQFMAFPLYATVGYLVWVLAGQTTESGLLMALFGLVLVAMAVWFYGRWNAPGASAGRARFGVVAGALVLLAGGWLGWPQPPAANEVTWEKWSPETVAKLRADGRIVYVDFTARWCATCQANKKLVFHSQEVLDYFRDKKIATLRGDWTNKDPQITAELAAYQRSAVPFNLIWMPGKSEPVILPELLTPDTVLNALRQK
ncbi:MAG TPA: protein-disulfide reductase DsbD family protein [Opitutaceae bacterium]|nr:protein-disulfide reductase DsbD family protein [Opitutaceae bacterium]